ncbi:MAG: hypothetical protein J2P38_03405 [Candidatus Dormibacteraeota bacterium]|nr:hypothetical protein [Candidatus Dormibacteraeota bacterium]
MPNGFVRWYRGPMLEYDAALQVQRFARAGFTFESPDHPPIAERLVASDDVSEVLRTPAGNAVPVRFQRLRPDVLMQLYLLDVSHEERDQVEALVWDSLRHELSTTLGLVVDQVAHARKVDWDALVLEGTGQMKRLPEVLLLREPADREEETPFRRFALFEHRVR